MGTLLNQLDSYSFAYSSELIKQLGVYFIVLVYMDAYDQ